MSTIEHKRSQASPFPGLLAYTHMPSRAIIALNAVRGWQSRRRTERALEAMPYELRKDIGWPTSEPAVQVGSMTRKNA